MKVRRARPGDEARLAAVHIKSWQVAYSHVFSEPFLMGLDVEARQSWFERMVRQKRDILVTDRDELTGFCFVGESRGDVQSLGEVYAIYVHPDHWGNGDGFALLRAGEAALAENGYESAVLWVLEANTRARNFYERCGWNLGKPVRLEEIGGTQVTEVMYQKDLTPIV